MYVKKKCTWHLCGFPLGVDCKKINKVTAQNKMIHSNLSLGWAGAASIFMLSSA